MGLTDNHVFKTPRLWQSSSPLKLWNPKYCFIFSDALIASEYIGYVPENKFKDSFVERVYDFDGVSLPKEISDEKYEDLTDEYIQCIISTLRPFGTNLNKRVNLARLIPGKNVPYAYILGIYWE